MTAVSKKVRPAKNEPAPKSLGDLPVVFLSYDEPWADETYETLRDIRPDALRVHGVKGLNACHQAAGHVADGAEWFLTVDADTTVDAAAFDVTLPNHLLQPYFRLDWLSRNAVNGLVSGNGCLKLWPSEMVSAMRSHEAAPPDKISLDADIGEIVPGTSRQVLMPGCYSTTNPARTPYHAFRSGFREAAFLTHLRANLLDYGMADTPQAELISETLRIWCTIGAHASCGPWLIYGARLAFWMHLTWSDWDVRAVNDYDWLTGFWEDTVVVRIGAGGSRSRHSSLKWDADRLAAESSALGRGITERGAFDLADFDADTSRLIAESRLFPAARSGAALDALGRAFQIGQGVPVDNVLAKDLHQTAALMDLPSGYNNLARLHERKVIPDADPTLAECYFTVATALGNPHAPYHLAHMLKKAGNGDEAQQDRVAALLDLAAERGFSGPPDSGDKQT